MNLNFEVKSRTITINDSGEIHFDELYRAIRQWEASPTGMSFSDIIKGSGNVGLPDGTRTQKCMIFQNGWRLAAVDPVSITGCFVTGVDEDGNARHPVVTEARDRVRLMHEEPAEAARRPFIPVPQVLVDTPEEIDESARRRFTSAPEIVIAEARKARAITSALQMLLHDLRDNSEEAGEAQVLLEKQAELLDKITAIHEQGGDIETEQQSYQKHLFELLEAFLKAGKADGVMKGILAVAALSLADIAGVGIAPLAQAVIAGSFIGSEALKGLVEAAKGRNE